MTPRLEEKSEIIIISNIKTLMVNPKVFSNVFFYGNVYLIFFFLLTIKILHT